MAFTSLFAEEVSESSGQLPLVRQWCKEQIKADKDPYENPLELRSIRVSGNGDWVIADTSVCSGLINAKSALGKNLMELIPTLNGEGKALMLLPMRKGKLGFEIGVDDELKAWYHWRADEDTLSIARSKAPQNIQKSALTTESILSPVSPSTSGTKGSRKGASTPTDNGAVSEAKTALLDA